MNRTFEIHLAGFKFPKDLEPQKANFRFTIDVRFIDRLGDFDTLSVVLPGLDTYWECDPSQSDDPRYVRARRAPRFDMKRIDPWPRLIALLHARAVHSLRVKVWDVDREDWYERVLERLKPGVDLLLGRLGRAAGDSLSTVTTDALGDAPAELRSALLGRLAAGGNSGSALLFEGSVILDLEAGGTYAIEKGDWRFGFAVAIDEPD